LLVGSVQLKVAEPLAIEVTVIEKGASEVAVRPSLTEITIFENVPAYTLLGVPVS
jgi:hypothetical protein